MPTLKLPSALVTFWPASGGDARVREMAAAHVQPGVVQLAERLLAVLPDTCRENVFDDALSLGQAMLAQLHETGASEEVTGILVFPGEVEVKGRTANVIPDELLVDLEKSAPCFETPGLFLAGRATAWLGSRYALGDASLYRGPSGRRRPVHRVTGEAPQLGPWHNPEVLSRQVTVRRPEILAALQGANTGALQVRGPMGVGKSHAVWHFLQEQDAPWLFLRVRRSAFATGGLARSLVSELRRLAPEGMPPGGDALLCPEDLTPARAAELLLGWLDNTHRKLGASLRIACDTVDCASQGDLDLLANLLDRQSAAFRLILISRSGGPVAPQLSELSRIEIPPMGDEEFANLARKLFDGLSMDGTSEARLREASRGYPFALEEGLDELRHRGLIRRIYGNFFFAGGSDIAYQPSRRLARHAAAEAHRLGSPLALRILAAAEQPVPVEHLERACLGFGVALAPAWEKAFLAAGWLHETPSAWGPGLAFTCPAYGKALLETVAEDSVDNLRQSLGQALVFETLPEELTWETYQLMAGTADALPSLLHLSAKADTPAEGLQIFAALEKEVRLHRSRQGDTTTELELLWKLLPLGQRLGKLSQLEPDLERALELAVGNAPRYAALALVKAEHDQEQGRCRAAAKGIEAALMATEGDEHPRRALLLARLGRALLHQQRIASARKVFTDLLALVNRQGPTALGATCHFHLGEIALFELDYERSRKHHRRAARFRRRQGIAKPLAASLSAQGTLTLLDGDYQGALDLCRQAEEVLNGGEVEPELSEALIGQGRALGHLGETMRATPPLRRAFELREGRGSVARTETARLELARNQLDLGQVDEALEKARLASFQLSLLPSTVQRGDADHLVGQILFRKRRLAEAEERFCHAMHVHLEHGQHTSAALDSSWLLEIGLACDNKATILTRSAELDAALEELRHPIHGELLYFRLSRACEWLRQRGTAAPDPVDCLRRAHQELVRKLGFLAPEMRHKFLFNLREHQDLMNTAVRYEITLPSFTTPAVANELLAAPGLSRL